MAIYHGTMSKFKGAASLSAGNHAVRGSLHLSAVGILHSQVIQPLTIAHAEAMGLNDLHTCNSLHMLISVMTGYVSLDTDHQVREAL